MNYLGGIWILNQVQNDGTRGSERRCVGFGKMGRRERRGAEIYRASGVTPK